MTVSTVTREEALAFLEKCGVDVATAHSVRLAFAPFFVEVNVPEDAFAMGDAGRALVNHPGGIRRSQRKYALQLNRGQKDHPT